ncbi:dihydrolipoamide dehydrogenase [Malonomonas rubra DSM 5091]|uniref:Dihydrolipoyl dehydrogenase n=1 Tax=Malonomonas rubra DSM 5091 TaxID=1122189 RepID=A0A1M6IT64_MALRU|nr:NAD(P)/FAD-dependent oxidoreductase [Malonomonas rubra]SHJ37636.1 dihydrolipoamide dehydrogenase [Malonomonas rubra DSM 5091]
MKSFDVVVLGGGPGGLTAGMMLTAMEKSVALVQAEHDDFGGVCLNRGCMPTKALLKAATAYRYARQGEKYGLDLSAGPVDLKRLRAVADADLDKLKGMIQGSIDPSPVTIFRGLGSFQSEHEILITKNDGSSEIIRGEQIIIATGSESVELPFAPFDGEYILSSDHMLKNTELPERLLIVGGGAIGCEFATMYHSFGSQVTLVEAFETLLPREDAEAGKALADAFENQGISVKTGTMIEALQVENGQVVVKYKGSETTEIVDKVLVGVGRKPMVAGLNLDAAGVEVEKGAIKVSPAMQTSVPHIFAVGDVTGGLMLAHAAEKAGAILAMNMAKGANASLDEDGVPRVVFSYPEVAAIGVSEVKAGMKSFTMSPVPNGRSVVDKVAPAFVKLFAEEESSVITGAIIVGEVATEMIHELALAVDNRLTLEQVGNTVHAHPTHSTNVVKAVHHFQYQA